MLGRSAQKLQQQDKQRRSGARPGLLNRRRRLGPYLLVELILPGGTLVALSMYMYRHQRPVLKAAFARVRLAAGAA
jgi:hypothetical protein